MNVITTDIPGAIIIEPKVWGDERGFFLETYRAGPYAEFGIRAPLVQDNLSYSRRGVLRGLHCQHPGAQGKLVQVYAGEVFDVAVDVRRGSPTFGRWVGVTLSGENKRQFWVPAGFAHGFLVTSETALFGYKCSDYYRPETEFSVRWDDPAIGIAWPLESQAAPELSLKDQAAPSLSEIPSERLPAIEDYP
ncbi:dTDP-4-dehydrorhamnose 3,5-epimerase [Lamprocystis purpurea]|jgi:dTDP-4-dehydrorhamnose 3,5-epimerase|uniref:dTDP-4-dehydrorhamnose 3,5-epimerase n=1 Tax=Lamprocystis purpurea TaxID=61598 RepID=UPI00035CB372|nr:dTDP-4-dehydrorhamnose 3,5-epimerase [Lamprocystis purpurea]MBV5275988.1 dTDP-4-dehydrorhamnose 3,5-epimerase [Lamprocystis purpurea]